MKWTNKEIIFEFQNDWQQLIGKWNWYTFTFIEFYIENEKWLKGWSFQLTLLGLGIYVRFNYDIKRLEKLLVDEDEESD